MKSKYMKALVPIAVALLFALTVFWGCSEPGFDGTKPANKAPECYLANIPTEGTKYSKNPVLYWFATDEDGYIKEYRYVVKKKDDINGDPLTYITNVMNTGDYSDWERIIVDSVPPGKSSTTDTIQFFADVDPETFIEQYFFVQAVDNHGAVSNLTDTNMVEGNMEIDILSYRMFSRNNHAPKTHLSFEDTLLYFSLDSLSETYEGIPISWEGSDSLDYKRAQPKFEFHWQIYGPFEELADTSTTDPSMLIRESYDSVTNSVWVEDEATVLYNLYEKAPPSNETRTMWFAFKVVCRDDAFVLDSTPETTAFRAIQPKFEKDILLVDGNLYFGSFMIWAADNLLPTYDDPRINQLHDYYRGVFNDAGYPVSDIYFYLDPNNPYSLEKFAPPEDTLVKYKLVICFTEHRKNTHYTEDAYWNRLSRYLDVGGNLMIIGWNTFHPQAGKGTQPSDFGYNSFARNYLGLLNEHGPGWASGNTYTKTGPEYGNTNEELKWAFLNEQLKNTGSLPSLIGVDSAHLRDFYISSAWDEYFDTVYFGDTIQWPMYINNYPFKQNAEPWVNYFIKDESSEALYIAQSIYDNPRDFDIFSVNSIDGKPIAVRKEEGLYKTSIFGFSLYCKPRDHAVELIRGMMEWYFSD
jgi:hypothetical protein